MQSLSARIDLEPGGRIGPGKIALLEAINTHGSISAAGRAMSMLYRRAREFVEKTNGIFGVAIAARLTLLGHDLVRRFRRVERAAADAARAHLDAFGVALVEDVTVPELGA